VEGSQLHHVVWGNTMLYFSGLMVFVLICIFSGRLTSEYEQ